MARKPRVAPNFTPEELEQIGDINLKVLRQEQPQPVPIQPPGPQPGGMGMRGGKAGGFWYGNGGPVLSYAKGGKVVDYKHSFKRGRKF